MAGLALGMGGIAVFGGDEKPSYRPGTPSVTAFSFATSVPEAAPREPEAVPVVDEEPINARAAVVAFLQPLVEGRPDAAYALLDGTSRRRFPTLASWIRAQADRPTPLDFQVGTARPSTERPGAVEIDLTATHTPSLDATRGLVPGRSTSVWLVSRQNDAWRVSADPLTFRPVMPDEGDATAAVQAWVSLLAACDTPSAATLQTSPNLYGPASLVRVPCETPGTWTAGDPSAIDSAPDPRAFLAAFGPEVGSWARLVPVEGPGRKFLAAVAPMGDSWQVMGVALAGP